MGSEYAPQSPGALVLLSWAQQAGYQVESEQQSLASLIPTTSNPRGLAEGSCPSR